jgi:hypothetical protein
MHGLVVVVVVVVGAGGCAAAGAVVAGGDGVAPAVVGTRPADADVGGVDRRTVVVVVATGGTIGGASGWPANARTMLFVSFSFAYRSRVRWSRAALSTCCTSTSWRAWARCCRKSKPTPIEVAVFMTTTAVRIVMTIRLRRRRRLPSPATSRSWSKASVSFTWRHPQPFFEDRDAAVGAGEGLQAVVFSSFEHSDPFPVGGPFGLHRFPCPFEFADRRVDTAGLGFGVATDDGNCDGAGRGDESGSESEEADEHSVG